ncbi:MAG: hypothetical protein ABI056_06380 [Caulobacteraceae bacterium]
MSRLTPLLLSLSLVASPGAWAGTAVTTWHNDLARTGQNRSETSLTPAALRAGGFRKLCARAVDGQIYAQPLYLPEVEHGGHRRPVVFVATEHDSVYAFDADCRVRPPLWKTSFLRPGITTMPCTSRGQPQCDTTVLAPERGITATPVIDVDHGTIYIDAQSVESGVYRQTLHALDLSTGKEQPGSPVTIAAAAPGDPKKTLDPREAFQRSGLLLLRGVVYAPFASNDSASGWLIGYDARTLAKRAVFCVTPTGHLGGIWSGGAAPAVDAADSIYVATGNGTFDAPQGGPNYSMSVLRLGTRGQNLAVKDYFTPSDETRLSRRDLDLGSGGIMLIGDQPGAHPREALVGFKTGEMFLLDSDRLGHVGDSAAVQHLTANRQGIYTTPAYWNGAVYLAGVDGPLTQWQVENGRLPANPTHQSAKTVGYPGATPSISSDGAANGIVWLIATRGKVQGGPPAVLRAYDARDVSVELYDSNAAGTRDAAGPGVKFSVPTIADGRVFVGTQTELDIYGLAP